MTSSREQVRSVVARQASEWHVANQGGLLDRAGRLAFVHWLKTSPMHVEEYLGIALITRDLRAAMDDPAESLDVLLAEADADRSNDVLHLDRTVGADHDPAERRRAFGTARSLAAIAACSLISIAAVLATGRYLSPHENRVVYRTAHGQQSVSKLPDSSTLHLNTDTEVTVRYSRSKRTVALNRGEAFFEVKNSPGRPFQVESGSTRVVAVGTRFNVYRKPGSTVVAVAGGRVDVIAESGGGAVPQHAVVRRVEAGYQLRIDDNAGPAQAVPVDLNQALGWLQRKIAFENRPLGAVANEFNRYVQVPLVIDDAALRSMPLSGSFDANDTESFVEFLETLEAVRVERTPSRIVLLRADTSTQEAKVPTH